MNKLGAKLEQMSAYFTEHCKMTSRDDSIEENIILFIIPREKSDSKNALFMFTQKLTRALIIIRLVDHFFSMKYDL